MPQHRALEWLHEYGRRYPLAWDLFASMQREHQAIPPFESLLPGVLPQPMQWPSWCWLPLGGAHVAVAAQEKRLGYLGPLPGTGELGAVANWRPTQGIYRLDPTLLEELWTTPLTGKVPVEVLKRLPEWCVYVEMPPEFTSLNGSPIEGFFAHLDFVADEATGRADTVLRLAVSVVGHKDLVPLLVYLKEGADLEQSLLATAIIIRDNFANAKPRTVAEMDALAASMDYWSKDKFIAASHIESLAGFMSVVLYLCAEETDVPHPVERPVRAVATKKGKWIAPIPKRPTVYDCGVRLGAELRWAREYYEKNKKSHSTGRTTMPHVRTAHWHTFLTGPRTETRIPKVKWLPPIRVNMTDVPETATLHPVK